ncbi:hypothetical protein K435DRAFT_885716, partial [Dendrothele bispora CBS 962.96]
VYFNSHVKEAIWDFEAGKWTVVTADGKQARACFLLLCTGIGSSYYVPEIKGFSSFKGACHHTSRWPHKGVDLGGKCVGVIGTGATGVQSHSRSCSHRWTSHRLPAYSQPCSSHETTPREFQLAAADGRRPLLRFLQN